MEKFLKWVGLLDWIAAVLSVTYGLYLGSWLWITMGALAFPLAWWNPSKQIHAKLLKHFTKKTMTNRRSVSIRDSAEATPVGLTTQTVPLPKLRAEDIRRFSLAGNKLPYGF
jgi:hypothetical protein